MKRIQPVIGATLLVVLLTGCGPRQPQDVPKAPAAPAETPAMPSPDAAPPVDTAPSPAPADPVQPTPQAPPPTEPSPAPTPTAGRVPAVESMYAATPGAKMSVAVDLKYRFDGAVPQNQPVTLHLAAIPRVAGSNFNVSIKTVPGLEVTHGTLSLQKVDAAGVYRQEMSVIRRSVAPANIRVLVTMDMPEGTAFGFFSIPLDGGQFQDGNTAQKSDSVKQR